MYLLEGMYTVALSHMKIEIVFKVKPSLFSHLRTADQSWHEVGVSVQSSSQGADDFIKIF